MRSSTGVADLRSRLAEHLARSCTDHDVPGASLVVTRGAEVVEVVHGVVNTRTGVPVTVDTVFQIQSVTKLFTATLVAQLVDEGRIGLDDPVHTHLPEFRTADLAASRRVTVRHLLTHTGGFEGDLWQPTTAGDDALDRFVRDVVAPARQYSPPGTRFSYCSAGFGVLGRLVEVQRGTTFERALRRHLAEPLGIDELAFDADQALAFRAATGHVRPAASAPLQPTRHWALLPPSNPAAGNQLAMSARGLARLGGMVVSGGRSGRGDRVLSETVLAAMLQPQLRHRDAVPVPVEQGLGWWRPRPRVAEHSGGAPGTVAMLAVVPDRQLTVALLANADGGARVVADLFDPLLADLAEVLPRPATPVPAPDVRVGSPVPYVGRYTDRQTDVAVVVDDDGRLWQTTRPRHEDLVMAERAGCAPSTGRYELRPLGPATFVRVAASGRPAGTVSFLEPDPTGRFAFVADERVAARVPDGTDPPTTPGYRPPA